MPHELTVYSCITTNKGIRDITNKFDVQTTVKEHLQQCCRIGWKDGIFLIWIVYYNKIDTALAECLPYVASGGFTVLLNGLRSKVKSEIDYHAILKEASINGHIKTMRLAKTWYDQYERDSDELEDFQDCIYGGILHHLFYEVIRAGQYSAMIEMKTWSNVTPLDYEYLCKCAGESGNLEIISHWMKFSKTNTDDKKYEMLLGAACVGKTQCIIDILQGWDIILNQFQYKFLCKESAEYAHFNTAKYIYNLITDSYEKTSALESILIYGMIHNNKEVMEWSEQCGGKADKIYYRLYKLKAMKDLKRYADVKYHPGRYYSP